MGGSLPLYIYIYTFFCFFIYKGGKSGGFLRVAEVTGQTGNPQMPLQNGQKWRFSAGFRRYHLKTQHFQPNNSAYAPAYQSQPPSARGRIGLGKKKRRAEALPSWSIWCWSVGDVEASACVGCVEVNEDIAAGVHVAPVARPVPFEAQLGGKGLCCLSVVV